MESGLESHADEPTSRRADEPTSRRADEPTSRRADEPTSRRADRQQKDELEAQNLVLLQTLLAPVGGDPCAPAELENAWNQVIDAHGAWIRQWLSSRALSEVDLEDCIQSFWERLVSELKMSRFDCNRGQARAWLTIVLRGAYVDFLRRQPKKHPLTTDLSLVENYLTNPNSEVADLEEKDFREYILKSVLKVFQADPNDIGFRAIRRRYLEEKSYKEIANELGLTIDQLYTRTRRSLERLRQLLGLEE